MRYYGVMLIILGLLSGCSNQTIKPMPTTPTTEVITVKAQQNKQLIEQFYQAFQQRNAEVMAASYANDAQFSDAVFIGLRGQQVGDMWRMLTEKAQNFSLVFDGVRADDNSGEAHWVATYTFSQTGNTVVNDIHARFTFKDGQIATHTDTFDLWRWSSQALGVKGRLLGWTPLVQNAIRKQAAKGLADYQAKRAGK